MTEWILSFAWANLEDSSSAKDFTGGPGEGFLFTPFEMVRAVKAKRSRAGRTTDGTDTPASSGQAPAGAATTSWSGGTRPGVRIAAGPPSTNLSSEVRPRPAAPLPIMFSPRAHPFRDVFRRFR